MFSLLSPWPPLGLYESILSFCEVIRKKQFINYIAIKIVTDFGPFRPKFQRRHKHQLGKFNEICLSSRKRKLGESETGQKQTKQQKVDVLMGPRGPANANLVSQAKVNDLVVGFITEGLMPFSVVEMPSFKELITALQPNRTVISRPTVMKRINEKATLIKENVKSAMAKAQHIATTTDCGTAR